MNYCETTKMPIERNEEVTEKRANMQDGVDALTADLTRLAQILNALCGQMAGADTDCIAEAPNAPLLMRLVDLRERTKYCLERAETLLIITGAK